MSVIPASRPQRKREEVEQIIAAAGDRSEVVLVGIRGYYRDTMGKVGVNDRNLYDDAIFLVSPDAFVSFNANCDPSIFKSGIATLVPGVYECVRWRHKGKSQSLQIVRDVLVRDGQIGESVGRRGINFHAGSERETWSEGCQTLPKSQFDAFIKLVYSEMTRRGQTTVPYILVENK